MSLVPKSNENGYFMLMFAPEMQQANVIWNQLTATLGRSGTKLSNREDFLGVGTYKTISREHCKIKWNSELQCFDLKVLGKRGIYSNSKKVEQNHVLHLSAHSCTPIKMGESRMYFCPAKPGKHCNVQSAKTAKMTKPSPMTKS